VGRLITLVASEIRKGEWPTIAREIAEQMDATGQTWIRVANRIPGAYALTACGEHDSVRRFVADLRTLIAGTCFVRYERDVLLIEANLALHEHEPQLARERLRCALQRTRQAEIPLLYAQNLQVFDRLLRLASQEDIEADTARALAARYGRVLDRVDAKPHGSRIRVVTMGRFELETDGRTLAFRGKAQQRPLGLLKLLASQGRRGAPVSLITEALWPDSEGDKAANALKVAVHRLRKLLGDECAVRTVPGSVFLDEQLCWTDVREFEEQADQAERHRATNQMDLFERAANAALALYQGPLLASEDALPWLVGVRDRLSQKARQLVLALGLHVEARGDRARACRLYESGLAIDALCEPLYQRLMSAHLREGRYAKAMQAFRRCREMLSIVLGIQPSAETRALFEEARARGAASVTGR
jgi:DNA-binding SARP family transcriptional activator